MDRRPTVPRAVGRPRPGARRDTPARPAPPRAFAPGLPLCFAESMEPVRIDAWDDPRLADFRNLKDAQLESERGRFIVEGRGNLAVLLERSVHRPDSILLSERAWKSLSPSLAEWAPDCPVHVAPQPILDRVVGFPIHRGVLAACPRGAAPDPIVLAREAVAAAASSGRPARLVLLEGLTNHDNVGGIFRNAMAFGVDAVLLCDRTCDPLYRKAIRTSMGGSLIVPFARAPHLAELLADLRAQDVVLVALDPDPRGLDLARLDPRALGHVALLAGTEGPGLTEATLAQATHRVRIAMEPGVDSLNVSVATAIALHRLRTDACAIEASVANRSSEEDGG